MQLLDVDLPAHEVMGWQGFILRRIWYQETTSAGKLQNLF